MIKRVGLWGVTAEIGQTVYRRFRTGRVPGRLGRVVRTLPGHVFRAAIRFRRFALFRASLFRPSGPFPVHRFRLSHPSKRRGHCPPCRRMMCPVYGSEGSRGVGVG